LPSVVDRAHNQKVALKTGNAMPATERRDPQSASLREQINRLQNVHHQLQSSSSELEQKMIALARHDARVGHSELKQPIRRMGELMQMQQRLATALRQNLQGGEGDGSVVTQEELEALRGPRV
jgi:hypothetical protein